VAAASILAKARFFQRLAKLSDEIGIELPPGAGEKVIETGRQVIGKHGQSSLQRVAKLHFRTTERIMESLEAEPEEGDDVPA
jgi:ribonuclease HIII